MNHRVARLWRAGLAFGMSALFAAAAQAACAPRLQINFPDGSRACLDDYAFSRHRAPASVASLARNIPQSVRYTLALPRNPRMCPPAIGYDVLDTSEGASPVEAERWRPVLRQCHAAVGLAGREAGGPCDCTVVLMDGRSVVSREEFDERAAGAAAPASVALDPSWRRGQAAVATAKPAPAPSPATNTASPGTAATAATSAEVAALRDQLQSLQAQVARQQAQPAAAPAPRLRARALVIGNGKYQNLGTLPNPPNDAKAMADKLRQFGIEVDLVLDANRSTLVKSLTDYQAKAAGYDINIFFYAGHGLQVDGINYVVPVEMEGSGATAGSVKLNAVSLNDALEYLPARTRLVFLDACRDNPLSRSMRATRSSAVAGLAPVNASSGTLVAYATKDGSVAEDGRGANSPYTTALLAHLDAEEDIAIVLRRVRQSVLSSTGQRQEPWEYGSLVGDQLVLSRLAR